MFQLLAMSLHSVDLGVTLLLWAQFCFSAMGTSHGCCWTPVLPMYSTARGTGSIQPVPGAPAWFHLSLGSWLPGAGATSQRPAVRKGRERPLASGGLWDLCCAWVFPSLWGPHPPASLTARPNTQAQNRSDL